ncbi:MAG: mandelate racemase/muconate lactonizing enzyme family protein [Planctomycetaceae bacterium]|nr:mandelate racemase/muconate lactonizing enzyme family protein [Planctomycetaceae bacterium]
MKITNVRACQPIAANSPPDWRTSMGQILIAVDTDVGLTGYGVGGGGLAGVHVARTVLRDVLLDRDPEQIDALWRRMYDVTLPFGQKGLAIMAISGADLALWDLRGKAANLPVAALLGGQTGQPIPTYVTVWDDLDAAIEAGFTAFKLHVEHHAEGGVIENVCRAVATARRQIGPDCQLMIDAWMRWDVATTLAIAERVAPDRLEWIEEPLPADDAPGYERLTSQCRIPIAGGEHEFTFSGFRPLIDRRLHQTLQPDVCWCGGLSELIKIYHHAQQAGLRVCPHRGAEVWGLHAIAALDHQPLAESGRPWMTWILDQPQIDGGSVSLSHTPGFGIQIDENSLPTQ